MTTKITKKQQEELLDQANAELCKRSLKHFVKTFWHVVEPGRPFIDGFHVDAICEHLEGLGKSFDNLLINAPPRIGKSSLCNVFFFCHRWAVNPSEKFLYASYSKDLTKRDSEKCRILLQSELYQKYYGHIFQIRTSQNLKERFSNTKQGDRISSAIGAAATGDGGSILVLDDALEASAATSENMRETAKKWIQSVWMNRLNPGGVGRVILGQRISRSDTSQMILENYDFCHLNLPWDFKPSVSVSTKLGWSDPRTDEGQELWPQGIEDVSIYKKDPRTWSAQWNQNPVVSGDEAFFRPESFSYFDETDTEYRVKDQRFKKSDCWSIATADMSLGKHDYTVVIIADIEKSGQVFIRHVVREKLKATAMIPRFEFIYSEFQPSYMLIENNAGHDFIVQELKQRGLPARGVRSDLDKESRARPLQFRFESGNIHFKRNAAWIPAIENELLEFPQGGFDDFVDAAGILAAEANKKTSRRVERQVIEPAKSHQQVMHEALLRGIF